MKPTPPWTRVLPSLLVGAVIAQSAPGQSPQFRAAVSQVQVDVIATDADGFIEDLTVDDLRVWEDGERVEILGLELVGSRSSSPAEPAALGQPARQELGAESSPAFSTVVFLVDGPSLSPTTKARFADAWKRIIASAGAPEVPRAAYYVDHTNRLVQLAPLTYDRDALLAAADTVAEAPITTDWRQERLIDLVSGLPRPGEPSFMRPRVAGRVAVAKARVFENQERARAFAAYEVLTAFCDALWPLRGRTAVVWVSSGVKLMTAGPYVAALSAYEDAAARWIGATGEEIVPGIRQLRAELNDPDDGVLERQRRLHEAANSANVSIYPIDPTPLIDGRMAGADARVGPEGFREALADPGVGGALDALGDSLRNAADATGGRAFLQATDLSDALRDVEADASRYYLLTYRPPRSVPDGAYHEIQVQVDRPGARARSRGGYVHLNADERVRRAEEAAQLLPGLAAGVEALGRVVPEVEVDADDGQVAPDAAVLPAEPVPPLPPLPDVTPAADEPTELMVPEVARVETSDVDPELRRVLVGLARTARFYRENALAFSCDETVLETHYRAGGSVRQHRTHALRYIYTLEDPPEDAPPGAVPQLRDYRVRRDEDAEPGKQPDEVRLADLDLVAATERAYSWAFLFQEGLQPYYRFGLAVEERALGRDAVIIAFEPVNPMVENLNDWFGRAWVDRETFQVLRVEALQAEDNAELDEIEKDRLRMRIPTDGRLVVRLTAEFGIEERGIRYPTKVVLEGEDFSMRSNFGIPGQQFSSTIPSWELRGRVAFRVEQRYENYRFFNVEVREGAGD